MCACCHRKRAFGRFTAYGRPVLAVLVPLSVINRRSSILTHWNRSWNNCNSFGWTSKKVSLSYCILHSQYLTQYLTIEIVQFTGTPTESLWKHEWLKHGTCALVLPELSTENKYFGQGLAWLQQYSMAPLLARSGVLPDENHNVMEIQEAIKNTLNKNPSIHCIKDRETGDTYLSEIRICFSKQLELVDCDGVVRTFEENVLTNCPADTQIHYPSVLPAYLLDRITPETPPFNWRTPLVNFYKLIQLIKWFTL